MNTFVVIGGGNYLTKAGLLLKLSPLGIQTHGGLNRFLRENADFPILKLTANRPFFCEASVDDWLSRQHAALMKGKSKKPKSRQKQTTEKSVGETNLLPVVLPKSNVIHAVA